MGRVARALAPTLAGMLLLSACGDESTTTRRVEVANEGIQMSGQVGGAQLSVSYGDPEFSLTDCDPEDGIDRDWCLTTRSIDGARVVLVIENPAIFVPGAVLDVALDRCADCDDVEGAAVVDLVVDGTRRRAIDGTVRVLETGERYALSFSLRFADGGTITGECNVRPTGVFVPPLPTSESPTSTS